MLKRTWKSGLRKFPTISPISLKAIFVIISNSSATRSLSFQRKLRPLNSKNLFRRLPRPMCDALRLPAITWHSFRHTHATIPGEIGESLRTAQALLAHSDLETTLNVYTHAIPESQRRAVGKVAEVMFAD